MVDTVTQTFDSLSIDSKRLYRKRRDDATTSNCSYTHSTTTTTTTNPNDWHRLLLARLKPGVTGKYRTTTRNGNKLDTSLSTSMDDSTVTLQSFSEDSSIIDSHHINLMESFDLSKDSFRRRENHFVKNYVANRLPDHITSLRRRVRKQQMRYFQRRPTIFQETTYQLPSPQNLYMISYPEPNNSSRRYRPKKSSNLVTLPPVPNTRRIIPTHTQGLKLNLFGY